jgi:uncharacterized membrane protein YfcA
MMGSMIGVLANQALPAVLLQVSLTLLLIFLTYQSTIKAFQIYRKESIALAKKKKSEPLVSNQFNQM